MGEGLVDKLKQEEGMDLDVTWLPFEIHPDTPQEGVLLRDYFAGFRPAQLEAMHQNLKARADELGLPLGQTERMANTHKALILAEYVRDHHPQQLDELHHRLFTGYLVDDRNLADEAVLADLCRKAGVPEEAVQRSMADPQYEERLEQVMAQGHRYGITGTPTFIIADRYKIVGAQPYDVLRDALRTITAELNESY